MKRMTITSRADRPAFTLVELMVVIGIIAVLIGLLMPALTGARLQGQRIKCMANMKNIGDYMTMYSNDNKGLLVPLGPLQDGTENTTSLGGAQNGKMNQDAQTDANGNVLPPSSGDPYTYMTLGSEVYPWCRWPYLLIPYGYAPIPTANLSQFLPGEPLPGDPTGVVAGPWTSPLMVCPSDPQPGAAHSYLFNEHLVQDQMKVLKYSAKPPSNQTNGQVVVLGEKRSSKDDYYMEQGDFPTATDSAANTHVELYRHGAKLGSNYLFKDMHVANQPPSALSDAVDPWDIVPVATTSSN